MAVVKFSASLRDQIINNAKEGFSARDKAVHDSFPNDWGLKIYDRLFGRYEAILSQIPNEMMTWDTNLQIVVRDIKDEHGTSLGGFMRSFDNIRIREFKNMPPVLSPMAECQFHYDTTRLIIKMDHPEWADLKQDVVAYLQKCHAIEQQKKTLVEALEILLKKHVTLAPALKEWQPLWDLLPPYVRDKHMQISERKRKDDDDAEINIGAMTAILSANKITR